MNAKDIRKVAIIFALAIIGLVLPGIGVLTSTGITVLCFFICMLIGWSGDAPGWVALVLLILYCVGTGGDFSNTIISAAMGHYIVWMLIVIFWFAACMQASGICDYIAKKILCIRLAKKGPYVLMALFLFAAWFISIFVQAAIAVTVLLLALIKSVNEQLNLEKYNKWSVLTGLGVGLFSLLGVMVLPFNSQTLVILSVVGTTYNVTNLPQSIPYIVFMLVFQLLGMALYVLATKYIVRPKVDFTNLQKLDLEGNSKATITRPIKFAFASIIAVIIIMFIPMVAPADSLPAQICTSIGVTGAFGLATAIMCFAKNNDNTSLIDFATVAKASVSWNPVLFAAGVFYFGGFMGDASTGIPQILSAISKPLGTLSPLLIICLVSIVVTLLSNIINNFVTILLFAPIGFNAFGADSRFAPLYLMMLIVAAYLAIALPSASSSAIFLHADKELFQPKQLIKYGYIACMLLCVLACILIICMQGFFA